MNRLMLSSDPYISTLRCKQSKERRPLPKDVLGLLIAEGDEETLEKIEDMFQDLNEADNEDTDGRSGSEDDEDEEETIEYE